MQDLKEKTIRAGSARMIAQATNFLLRIVSMMVLARLLDPKDFGLVAMVTAFTGVLMLFRDFGLSAAYIQRESVTDAQSSTLFWVNLAVGAALTGIAIAIAPALSRFYHEPRLFWVTAIIGLGFVINGAGIQHSSILQRQMRFTALAVIDTTSVVVSTLLAFVMARAGYGYWALVVMTVCLPLISTPAWWITARWIPGLPRRGVGIRSMMRFGGGLTLNGLVWYFAYNFDKVILGRFWGVEAIGIYSRAYQLIRIPTDNLNTAVGEVAFSALSRVRDDAVRLKRYFLKGYSLVVALTLPITISCALFAEDIVSVMLGPKWHEAAPIVRLLAPTILVFAIANPLGWLLNALGLISRGLRIALVFGPFMIAAYMFGLRYGPKGVALSYSIVMILWLIPFVVWALHGTAISVRDILMALRLPLSISILAAGLAYGVQSMLTPSLSPKWRLLIEGSVLSVTYVGGLLCASGRESVYMDVIRGFTQRSASADNNMASVRG